jgi:hypothetical protein
MHEVEEGLWQSSAYDAARMPLTTDFMLWLCYESSPPHDSRVFYFPIPDSAEGLSIEHFWGLYGICQVLEGRTVTTVCAMGQNRSGLASAMILIARGWRVGDAIARVQTKIPNGLWNEGFVDQLRQLLECFDDRSD